MPEKLIDPKFNIHSTYRKVNIINPYRYGYTPPPTGGEIQPETTAYMNAIGVPNDSTATIYGKTGAEIWTLFNDCIMIAKNAGKLDDIHTWHPMFGITTDKLGIDALNPAINVYQFFGNWQFSDLGNQTNGSNTYAYFQNAPYNYMVLEDCAFTIACNSNVAVGASDNLIALGANASTSGTESIILSVKRYTNQLRGSIGVNSITTSSVDTTAAGITTMARISGILKLWKNEALLDSTPISSGALPSNYVYYGAYFNRSSPALFDVQRFISTMTSKGDDATVQVVHQMIDLWESGLGRKNW